MNYGVQMGNAGSIADCSNFMSDCKKMQAGLKSGKDIYPKRKKYQANMLQTSKGSKFLKKLWCCISESITR